MSDRSGWLAGRQGALGRGAGPRGERVGSSGEGKVGRGAAGLGRWLGLVGWMAPGFGLSFGLGFLSSFLFQTPIKLIEFNLRFEFKPYALNQMKFMHQHECTNTLNLY